ncbi:MAG: prolipoprotein diacylglyceryl transferase [Lachnospiraceae bacterium]|nr:prolipoprotein diacylglyceryl transferase [Lachnospiraceae bacterium]
MNYVLLETSIRFPNFGIELENVGKGISIFGFNIAFYGIIISIGMILGYLLTQWQSVRTGQDADLYLDFALLAIVMAVLGARIYYVVFSWDDYKNNLTEIFNIRGGGLAIYGGIIGGVLAALIFSKYKKVSFLILGDTACAGLALGQSIGRWGNFFNREAFGKYTDGLFAMQLRLSEVSEAAVNNDPNYLKNLKIIDGVEFIQVHPTFLYESFFNFLLVVLILLVTKHKKFNGQLFLIYIGGYGLIRTFIEALRTDQLRIAGTNIAVSQLLGLVTFVVATVILVVRSIKVNNEKKKQTK